MFSAKYADNDNSIEDCAALRGGGWWYNKCGPSSLNGAYVTNYTGVGSSGVWWNSWKTKYSFKTTELKIRRA